LTSSMTDVADEMPGQAEVLAELKEVRRRGYTQLDATRTRPTRIDTPSLEYAAAKIKPPGYRPDITRMAVIDLLLKHEIAALGEPFAELLTISFGARRGLNPSDPPGLRRQAARLAKQRVETFKIDKEAVALKALANQIIADCLADHDPPQTSAISESTPIAVEYTPRPASRTLDPQLRRAIRDLADGVRTQLQEEERLRRVSDPILMPVRWSTAAPHMADQWRNIHRVRQDADPVPLDDMIDNVADVFEAVPSRRLVVLGRGGAGKTTLVTELALALLAPKRRAWVDAPVPVIFRLASWNPVLQPSLDDWLVAQLTADHKALGLTTRGKGTLASQLVKGRHIIPLLDGFDELAPDLRAEGIHRLNMARDHGEALVLTSRPHEYMEALTHANSVFRYAAVIELEDLTLDDVVDYLPRTTRPVAQNQKQAEENANRTKWDPVLASMRSAPEDVQGAMLLEVLSVPLMVSLARSIYSETPADPAELLDADRFPDAATMSDHLFDQFVKTAYEYPSSDRLHDKHNKSWRPEDARRWLSFLAVHLHSLATRDIAWWRIKTAVPGIAFLLAWISMCGIGIALIIFAIAVDVLRMALIGASFAAAAAGLSLSLLNASPKEFRRLTSYRQRLSPRTLLLMVTRAIGSGIGLGAIIGLIAATENQFRISTILFAVTIGFSVWLLMSILTAVVTGPANLPRIASPDAAFRIDFKIATLTGASYGLVCAAIFAVVHLIVIGDLWLPGLAIAVVMVMAVVILASASGAWLASRIWLASTGRLPWRTMVFFKDAHQRGILRQVGSLYQFRHASLQDRLASVDLKQDGSKRSDRSLRLRARANLAVAWLKEHSRFGAAESELRAVLQLQRKTLKRGHRDTLDTWHAFAAALVLRGNIAGALSELEALRVAQNIYLEKGDSRALQTSYFFASLLMTEGRHAEAVAEFEKLQHALELVDEQYAQEFDRGSLDLFGADVKGLLARAKERLSDNSGE
jgi:hypothetical protein